MVGVGVCCGVGGDFLVQQGMCIFYMMIGLGWVLCLFCLLGFRVVSNKRECYEVSGEVVLGSFIFGEHCISQRSRSINSS